VQLQFALPARRDEQFGRLLRQIGHVHEAGERRRP
jgi:hypothetical protein